MTIGQSSTNIDKALRHLRKDKNLSKLIKEFPKPVLTLGNDYFKSLTRSIIYQQLSGKAAGSIEKKFLAVFGKKKLEPKAVLKLTDVEFKSAGISAQKMKYLRDLSAKFLDGTVDPLRKPPNKRRSA
jgi:DNA-3-methyladenine glycosylase II